MPPPQPPATPPAIAEYAVLGDTRTAAMVARGAIDWLCLPRFDGEPVFGRLVGGEAAGTFHIEPDGARGEPVAAYRPGSAVLETAWDVPGGRVRLVDGMVAAATGSLRPQTLLVRRVTCEGVATGVRLRFDPRRGERHAPPRWRRRGPTLVSSWGGIAMSLETSHDLAVTPGADVVATVEPGTPLTVALSAADREPLVHVDAETAWRMLQETDRWWREWSWGLELPALGREAAERSLITLRLLTYAPSGAPVASVTTSLPEWPGGTRNWDYRYTWVRDASIGTAASLAVGNHDEAAALLYWLLHAGRLHRPRLPPALRIDGRPAHRERTLAGWPGHGGSPPVRVGNAASGQHQLDGYGWVVDAAWAYHGSGRRLYAETWRMVAGLADFVAGHWRLPDAGIWEARDDTRHHVHSKLMGWLALDRALRMCEAYRTRHARRARWRAERDALAADVRARGFDARRGTYRRAYGAGDLDAALLLLPVIGFDAPDAAPVRGTIDAVRQELGAGNGLLYRYRPGTDGIDEPEGAFLPCSFWLAQALAATGRVDEAGEVFEQAMGQASPTGLYAEQIHPGTGAHLGNTPMVLSHAALLQALLALGRAGAAG